MEIIIKDQNLREQICFQLNIPIDANLNEKDCEKITEININSETVTGNLNPVYFYEFEYFKNLKKLSLNNLKITKEDFKHILKLTNLIDLSFYSCSIESINEISALQNIIRLSFTNTFIKDFSPVALLKNIQSLDLIDLMIINLNFLLDLKKLKKLNLINLKCMDASALKNLKGIEEIYLDGMKNLTLEFLMNYNSLKKLSVSNEQLENNFALINELLPKVKIYKDYNILLNPEVKA